MVRVIKTGAALTRSDIASVLEAEKQAIADTISEGGAVNAGRFQRLPQHIRRL
ncbi:MAG: hypothetical protein LBG43_01735 [Treponema sp.]|jgi:hypothetical protein|nr:hypothetical protein [Treponema sp.]